MHLSPSPLTPPLFTIVNVAVTSLSCYVNLLPIFFPATIIIVATASPLIEINLVVSPFSTVLLRPIDQVFLLTN